MKIMTNKICLALMLLGPICTSYGTDFNDGISPSGPIDDTIQEDINDEFISQKIIGKLNVRKGKEIITEENGAGVGNIIIGPKANLKGAIILNNSDNKGAAAVAK